MLAQTIIVIVLIAAMVVVLWSTHVYRKRRLPCKPDAADLERRRRIRAGFGGGEGSDQV